MKRRVVVTGIGMVTPLGTGVQKTWAGILEGRSGIDRITLFDATNYPSQIAGEVKDFNLDDFIEPKEQKKMDRFIHLALGASTFAMEDSGLKITRSNELRVGVSVGSGIGGLPAIEKYHSVLLAKGPKRITPFFIPMVIVNLAAGQISMRYGAKGPNAAAATACATGSHSIGDAFKIIQRNDADVMIAGGGESAISPLGIAGFSAMKALSTRNHEPQKASRPFDKDREGFVMGEGAGIIIIEALEHALKRDAKIYAELVGYGMSADAYHITSPPPDASGAIKCMLTALADANIKPEQVDYINAHGTSTKQNDELETLAIKKVFGQHAYKLAVSSTKSMIGHLLGASGGVESIFSVLTIQEGKVPPTINLDNPDPHCDLDYVPHKTRNMHVEIAMSNSFGFGGTNATLIFRKYRDN
ncbi:MAG TPA: beta-ketoacyl-ACP synthase II [Thermodesulfovibrionia bacterium]|nr:beta-ketoacyl-ACP synthase II [Thermodesulfovibrionia bacterium]